MDDDQDEGVDWAMVVGALFVIAALFSLAVLFDLTF